MAIRYVGKKTKITLRWKDAHGYPAWVAGHYSASFNCGGAKMDNVILHVFKGETGGAAGYARTPEDLGLHYPKDMGTPRAFDTVAGWAVEALVEGAAESPHWRYGKAKRAAKCVQEDIDQNGGVVKRFA